jgi:DNA-binding transcriptional MerR regulator
LHGAIFSPDLNTFDGFWVDRPQIRFYAAGGRFANFGGGRTGMSSPELFRTRDVVEILGISRRQLQYWAQTDLAAPSAKTRGGHARYSFEDLVALKAAKRLIDAGVSVQRIRRSIRRLRAILPQVRRPLSELTLVATGDVVLAFHAGTAIDAVSGQEWVFEVAQFQRELDAWRRPAAARPAARLARRAVPTRVQDRTA